MKKMKLYEALVCDDSKILSSHMIRTRLEKKDVEKRIKFRINLINKDIGGFCERDDLE